MSDLVSEHQQGPEINMSLAIQDAVLARNLSVTPDRMKMLMGGATYVWGVNHLAADAILENAYIDPVNCVTVRKAKHSEDFGPMAALVDFAPFLEDDGDLVSGYTSAQPGRASQYTLMALHGMQNYVLLVDAGAIPKPITLYGHTNPEMASIAERLGMFTDIARQYGDQKNEVRKRIRQSTGKLIVSGDYDEVSRRLFSDDMRRLEAVLTRRTSAQQQAGSVAVHASKS